MESVRVTEAELIEALRAASAPDSPADALTMQQIIGATGWGEKRARRHLHALVASGDAEVVSVQRTNLIGVLVTVPAYRLTRPAQLKAA